MRRSPMIEDRSAVQARELLATLYEHVNEVSPSIAETEHRSRNAPPVLRQPDLMALRKDPNQLIGEPRHHGLTAHRSIHHAAT